MVIVHVHVHHTHSPNTQVSEDLFQKSEQNLWWLRQEKDSDIILSFVPPPPPPQCVCVHTVLFGVPEFQISACALALG